MRTDHARGVSWRSTPCVAERWLRVGVENRANIKTASKTIAAKSCERFVCVIVVSRAGQELCACVAFRGLDLFESVGCERHVLHGAASPCTALRRWRCRAWRGRHSAGRPSPAGLPGARCTALQSPHGVACCCGACVPLCFW